MAAGAHQSKVYTKTNDGSTVLKIVCEHNAHAAGKRSKRYSSFHVLYDYLIHDSKDMLFDLLKRAAYQHHWLKFKNTSIRR